MNKSNRRSTNTQCYHVGLHPHVTGLVPSVVDGLGPVPSPQGLRSELARGQVGGALMLRLHKHGEKNQTQPRTKKDVSQLKHQAARQDQRECSGGMMEQEYGNNRLMQQREGYSLLQSKAKISVYSLSSFFFSLYFSS